MIEPSQLEQLLEELKDFKTALANLEQSLEQAKAEASNSAD